MNFKNFSESATLLAQKIKEEELSSYSLFFINYESEEFANLVAQELNQTTSLLEDPNTLNTNNKYLIIIDRGDTLAQEYNEFTDILRQKFPSQQIVIAIPTIPSAEEGILKDVADILIYLHSEPNFFSINQFYQEY
jgi:predicted phosphoribosyltransferase